MPSMIGVLENYRPIYIFKLKFAFYPWLTPSAAAELLWCHWTGFQELPYLPKVNFWGLLSRLLQALQQQQCTTGY